MSPLLTIVVIASIVVAGWVGIQHGRREGVWAGIGATWIGFVAVSVVWSIMGNIIAADSFWDGLTRVQSLFSPWDVNTYIIMAFCLPSLPFFWLQARRNAKRAAKGEPAK